MLTPQSCLAQQGLSADMVATGQPVVECSARRTCTFPLKLVLTSMLCNGIFGTGKARNESGRITCGVAGLKE